MPRLRSIGFMPAATALAPSRTIAWASTVAVVVPSPATSLLLLATSRTICAPMFSNLSASSISLATVTPSLVIRGAPKLLSRTTLRPLGPSVTFTASARMSTPRSMRRRASPPSRTSLAAICVSFSFQSIRASTNQSIRASTKPSRLRPTGWRGAGRLAFDDAHDVGLLHDQELLAVELDLGAGPLAEQDAITGLHVRRHQLTLFIASTRSDGDDFALHRLFLGGVGDDDASGGPLLGREPADNNAVVQGTKIHRVAPQCGGG